MDSHACRRPAGYRIVIIINIGYNIITMDNNKYSIDLN